MKLVVVEGIGGVGKTTVANRLAEELNCVVFSKDTHKEQLFDKLDKKPSLLQWLRIDKQGWQALYNKITELLGTDETLIVDGDFRREQIAKVAAIINQDTKVVELYCFARTFVPVKRFIRRSRRDTRNRGHRDGLWYVAILVTVLIDKLGIKICGPFELKSTAIKIDTTDFDSIAYGEIAQRIRDE